MHGGEEGIENKTVLKKQKQKVIREVVSANGIMITSYETLRADAGLFKNILWYYTILDEAQKIKNWKS
jgi:SNF2 family DNA or RNA helicase